MKSFFWLIVDFLINFVGGVCFTTVNFLIWNREHSLVLLLKFNLVIFLTIALASLVAGFVTVKIGAKISFFISILLRSAVLFIAAQNLDNLISVIYLIAVIIGSYTAFHHSARKMITDTIVPPEHRVKFFSRNQIFRTLIAIISPLVTTLAIANLGYATTLTSGSVILFIALVVFLLIRTTAIPQTYAVHSLFKEFFHDSNIRNIVLISFASGVGVSMTWGLFDDIVVLDKLGSMNNWTIIATIVAVLGAVVSFLLGKVKGNEYSKIRGFISLSALLLSTGPVLLLINFSQETYIFYTITSLVFAATNAIMTAEYVSELKRTDFFYKERITSYQNLVDISRSIGMMIPIFLFLQLPESLVNTDTLLIGMLVVTMVPLLFLFAYKKLPTLQNS
jgi:hypothetical protein